MRTGAFIGLATLAATSATHSSAFADTPPAGSEGTYKVTVNLAFSGTGVALPTKGWMITAQALFGNCNYSTKEGDCVVSVEDPVRHLWTKADLVAVYTRYGLALVHLRETLPTVSGYANREAVAREPVHALAFRDKDVHFMAGNIIGLRTLQLFGEPDVQRPLAVSSVKCKGCSNGTPVFTLNGELLGVHVGTADAEVDGESVEEDVMLSANDLRKLVDWYRPKFERKTAQSVRTKK